MNLEKNQLFKMVRDAPQSHLLVLTITPLAKDSVKTAITNLNKFLGKNIDYTIIAIKK
jgi:hypothetical protein